MDHEHRGGGAGALVGRGGPISRRRFLLSFGAAVGAPGGGATYAFGIEPTWVEVTRQEIVHPALPAAFDGLRVAHISDLHRSGVVSQEYLGDCMRRVNDLGPDLVAITGDFTTRGADYHEDAVCLVAELRAPFGVYACLGNHDYCGPGARRWSSIAAADRMAAMLGRVGVVVLRNGAEPIRRGGAALYVVGLDDLWAGRFEPEAAFAQVPAEAAALTLTHNPDTMRRLEGYPCHVVLAGHTHGGQIDLPLIGAPILPVAQEELKAGLYPSGPHQLYVNRGLGNLGGVRFNCRPEITLMTLRCAGPAPAAPRGAGDAA